MINFEQKNFRFFSRWSKTYGRGLIARLYFAPLYRRIIQVMEESNMLVGSVQFLDVACGTGEVIFQLAQKFPDSHFTGVDLTPEMIKKAQEKNALSHNTHFEVGNAGRLPFASASCDVMLCSEAFHHFAAPEATLAEMYRVLKPGGIFLLVDPSFNNAFVKMVFSLFKWVEHAYRYYSKKDLESMLVASGFAINKSFTYRWNNFVMGKK